MRAILLSTIIAIGASCTVTAYSPTGGSQQGQQQTGSGGGTNQTSPPAQPAPAPAPAPTPAPTPPASPPDMATHPTAPPDMATTTSADCMKLSNCCAQLPDPNDQQQCMDAVAGLNDQVCSNILQQLQDNGYCQ